MQPAELMRMPLTFDTGMPGPAKHILCYGDSLTAGFFNKGHSFEPYARTLCEKLADSGMACKVSFCGFSGRTAEDMVQTAAGSLSCVVGLRGKGLIRTLEEDGPFDLVLIMAGTNDLGFGATHERLLGWLRRLHRICHERGTPTVCLAPPPAPCAGKPREGDRQRLVALLRRAFQGNDGKVIAMDPAEYVSAADAKLWDHDGLHFSQAGSRALGRGLASLVLEWFASCAARNASRSQQVEQKQMCALASGWSYSHAPASGYATPSMGLAPPFALIRRMPVYAGA